MTIGETAELNAQASLCLSGVHATSILDGLDDHPVEADDVTEPKRPRKKPGPKPKRPEEKKIPQPSAITIRGSEEWYDWLRRLSAKYGVKPTAMICLALSEMARKVDFEDQPPRT